MPNFNQITIVGHVGTINLDGDYKKFSVAYTRKYIKKDGEKIEKTEWFNCVSFNDRLNKVIENYIKKGVAVLVVGTLSSNPYLGKDGTAKVSLDIALNELQILTSKKDAEEISNNCIVQESNKFNDEVPF